ncbi:MAG: ABC transporter ATP-binding protein [Deltaproteobacteria bacterium]|nr:ABC transporter ATP-binding protein [Deltaproteobacteria bacterium]
MMIVEIDNTFKSYGKAVAVNGVSLKIEKGERVVILGPSGCGKTTILRMLAGFIHPDKGRIAIDGFAVANNGKCLVEPENRQVGMVFQDLALWPHMNVYKNLAFGLKAKKVSKKERGGRIDEILEKVQMTPFRNAYPGDLSGGQQQRIALARALVMQPKILLMDEPLSSLDIDLNLLLRKEILRLQEELAITMLYVTHDRDEAFSLASRIVIMECGKIRKIGTVNEITAYLAGLSIGDN